MRIEFKKCDQQDIPQLIQVSAQSYREHYTYLWEDKGENYIANNFNKNTFTKELLLPNSEFYLILWQSEAVGFFKINDIEETYLELERIYLIAEAKGKGIGKAAVDFVENLAISTSKSIICLKAMQKGRAYLFYEKCGFEIVDEYILKEPFIKKEYNKMYVMEKVI
ncbi:MAG: GNAT family N-acetyltransferase [Bacteroidota bacterium]